MLQRLGIAQALLCSPPVLILDEPTAGLDPEERTRFRNILTDLSRDRVIILSTHVLADIESSCSTMAILKIGSALFCILSSFLMLFEGLGIFKKAREGSRNVILTGMIALVSLCMLFPAVSYHKTYSDIKNSFESKLNALKIYEQEISRLSLLTLLFVLPKTA